VRSEGPTDRELLERYVAGDARAFDLIVDRYERRVYVIALRMCGDSDDARDVSQTVFINALRALPGFREEAQLSTWFHRVAVNASLDHLRKQKRQPTDPLDSVGDRPSEGPSPEDRAVSAVRAAEVQAALRRLSDEHRAVLVLHDIQDLDYAGVAHALDIPVGTVKSRIHRARLELAKLLGHLRETSEGTERSSGPSNKR
jgi:RNA polymerase sigma-70 factor (ECF subfamily)